jgi:hypothetical protein
MNRRAWGWLTLTGILLAAVFIILLVTGTFEDPTATATELREIDRALAAGIGDVVAGEEFDVTPWMELIAEVDSFLNRAGFAKDELRAAVRALGRYAEGREDRDRELVDWHRRRFQGHLRLLEQGG